MVLATQGVAHAGPWLCRALPALASGAASPSVWHVSAQRALAWARCRGPCASPKGAARPAAAHSTPIPSAAHRLRIRAIPLAAHARPPAGIHPHPQPAHARARQMATTAHGKASGPRAPHLQPALPPSADDKQVRRGGRRRGGAAEGARPNGRRLQRGSSEPPHLLPPPPPRPPPPPSGPREAPAGGQAQERQDLQRDREGGAQPGSADEELLVAPLEDPCHRPSQPD